MTHHSPSKQILVCQNRTCCKQGSKKLLEALQKHSEEQIHGCRCLGHCGNGLVIMVLPKQKVYERVQLTEIDLFLNWLTR